MAFDLCNITAALQLESGRIGDQIAGKLIATDPWNRLVDQDAFPDQMGSTISNLIYERVVVPDATSTAWDDVTVDAGSSSQCAPTPQEISYARTTKSYNLQQAAIRGPYICVENIRFAWQFGQQLAEQYRLLTANTAWFWSNRYRDEYSRLCGNHIVTDVASVFDMSTSGSGSAFPASRPNFSLDQGMLDQWYLDLARDCASEGSYGMVNGMPQYALICSPETSKFLQKQNSDQRVDLRYSSKADDLLAPFGADWSYGGFRHVIDLQAPRYTFAGGTFTRVPFFTTSAASSGNKAIVNPSYREAPFECSFIYNSKVYKSRVPNVITSPGGNLSFKPSNYRGTFRFFNIQDNNCNLEGNQGFFFGKFMQGSEPRRTEWGYAIMHLRCNPATLYQNCVNS